MKHLGVLLALCCACAAAKPLPAQFTSAEPAQYPRARYVSATGLSQVSPEDAALRAKANVAASVQSRLQAESQSYLGVVSANGRSDETQTASETIRLSTSFEQANLIQVVDRAESGGTFYALAVLDRAVADRELEREQSARLVQFTQFAQTALQGGRTGALANAQKLLAAVDAGFIARRALLGHPAAEEASFLEQRNAVLRAQAELVSKRVVQVRVEGSDSANVLNLAVNAVRKLGLRVSAPRACTTAADGVTELVVRPEESCGESSLGERCEVTLQLSARACASGGVGEGRTPAVRGVHPSDQGRAREAAWKRMSDQTVESAVAKALEGALGDVR